MCERYVTMILQRRVQITIDYISALILRILIFQIRVFFLVQKVYLDDNLLPFISKYNWRAMNHTAKDGK